MVSIYPESAHNQVVAQNLPRPTKRFRIADQISSTFFPENVLSSFYEETKVIRSILQLNDEKKKLQNNISSFKDDIEQEIDTKEIKQDIYNELRMEELEQSELFVDKKQDD